jgi:hypothetical protein
MRSSHGCGNHKARCIVRMQRSGPITVIICHYLPHGGEILSFSDGSAQCDALVGQRISFRIQKLPADLLGSAGCDGWVRGHVPTVEGERLRC